MNCLQLKDAILGDCHRENYTALIARFLEQGEALIRSRLESYGLEYNFSDADRLTTTTPIYALPARVTVVKQMIYNNMVLDQTDETLVSQYRSLGSVCMFAMRSVAVIFAGTPPPLASIQMLYMGLPAALVADTDTNALL